MHAPRGRLFFTFHISHFTLATSLVNNGLICTSSLSECSQVFVVFWFVVVLLFFVVLFGGGRGGGMLVNKIYILRKFFLIFVFNILILSIR